MCAAVLDLHTHILPGIDDGPVQMADALAMARAFVESGTSAVVCTPHIDDDPTAVLAAIDAGVPALRAALDDAEIPLQVLPGAELTLAAAARMDDDQLARASLGGGGRWLLLEMPVAGWPIVLPEMMRDLEMRGFGVVLAHPERSESVQLAPDRLRDLLGRGALVQINASSLSGAHGARAERAAYMLLRNGMVTVLASDAHSATARPPGLVEGLQALERVLRRPQEELRWMVDDGPRLIASGAAVRPPRLVPMPRPPR